MHACCTAVDLNEACKCFFLALSAPAACTVHQNFPCFMTFTLTWSCSIFGLWHVFLSAWQLSLAGWS